MIREITRSRLLARDRVSHDALLGFQQSVHFLIASILIVPGDEFGMRDEPRRVAGNSEIAMTRFEWRREPRLQLSQIAREFGINFNYCRTNRAPADEAS